MTATADPTAATSATDLTTRARNLLRTGGPEGGSSWLEHVLGWTLVVVVAMFVTQVGWL